LTTIQTLLLSLFIASGSACVFLTLRSARTSAAGSRRASSLKPFVAALTAFTILFIYSHNASCASTFIITLSNGNVIEANSYSIEKDKVRLKYPVGEVAFPLKEVLSIKEKDGSLDLLQSAGVFAQHKDPKPLHKAVSPTALALSDRRPSMLRSPVIPKGPANPDIKNNTAQFAHANAGRRPDMPKTRQPGTPVTLGFGDYAEDNADLTDAMERYLATDNDNERARLDQTINGLLNDEEQQQENDNSAN
jgi:hypothetical protein